MRKLIFLLGFVLFAATVASSCKPHQKCPAYGKTTSPRGYNAR